MNVPDERGLKREKDCRQNEEKTNKRRDERPRREGIETIFNLLALVLEDVIGEMNGPDERGLKPERVRDLSVTAVRRMAR